MTKNLNSFSYKKEKKLFVSYNVPADSLNNSFDFSSSEEHWNNTSEISLKEMYAVIEEIHNKYLVLNCLVDEKNRITQRRKFDKEPFNDHFELFEGEGVKISIKTMPGRREFIYIKADVPKIMFEDPEDLFSDYKGSSLFPK